MTKQQYNYEYLQQFCEEIISHYRKIIRKKG
jgi:hypothetical protein